MTCAEYRIFGPLSRACKDWPRRSARTYDGAAVRLAGRPVAGDATPAVECVDMNRRTKGLFMRVFRPFAAPRATPFKHCGYVTEAGVSFMVGVHSLG